MNNGGKPKDNEINKRNHKDYDKENEGVEFRYGRINEKEYERTWKSSPISRQNNKTIRTTRNRKNKPLTSCSLKEKTQDRKIVIS